MKSFWVPASASGCWGVVRQVPWTAPVTGAQTAQSLIALQHHGQRYWLTHNRLLVPWMEPFTKPHGQHNGADGALGPRTAPVTDAHLQYMANTMLLRHHGQRQWELHTLAAPIKLELALSAGSEALEASVRSPQHTLPCILNLNPVPTLSSDPQGNKYDSAWITQYSSETFCYFISQPTEMVCQPGYHFQQVNGSFIAIPSYPCLASL